MAAFDCFLKLDGAPGESKDHKHKDEIEINSWGWGAVQGGSFGFGGGGGTGKVQIGVQGRLQIFDAVSAAKVPIASGERVRVASVVSGNIMVVEKL